MRGREGERKRKLRMNELKKAGGRGRLRERKKETKLRMNESGKGKRINGLRKKFYFLNRESKFLTHKYCDYFSYQETYDLSPKVIS